MKILVLLVFIMLFSLGSAGQMPVVAVKPPGPIFVFHTDEFWLNLHHFLYVLGRAQNNERDTARTAVAAATADQEKGLAALSDKEKAVWKESVDAYAAGLAKKDMVFEEPLPSITAALAQARGDRTLKKIKTDPTATAVLERAAPVYRKAFWNRHQAANREWEKMIRVLVDRHGARVLAFLTRSYQMQWPASGFPIHLSAYANWAGAYSVTGNILVVSSLAPDLVGVYGLETIFHEGMHQWDNQMDELLAAAAKKEGKQVPNGLSHALVFYTAGEAVRNVIPSHIPYAEKFGVWRRGLAAFKAPIEEIWKPYLDGRGTRDEALSQLVARVGPIPTR